MWVWGGSWQNGSAVTRLLYSVCYGETGIAIVGINYLSALSNISTRIIQCKIPIQSYVTRNYPTPQVVVYDHHPIADWFRNLPHGKLFSANVYQMLLLVTGCDFHQSATVYHGQAFAVIVLFTVNPAEPINETSKIRRPKIFTYRISSSFSSFQFLLSYILSSLLRSSAVPPLDERGHLVSYILEKLSCDSFNCIRQRDQHTYLGIHLRLSGMCIWFLINIDDIWELSYVHMHKNGTRILLLAYGHQQYPLRPLNTVEIIPWQLSSSGAETK